MKIRTDKNLESTGYRCLFEYVKKEGIEPIFEYVQDIYNLPKRDTLLRQVILTEEDEFTKLLKTHKEAIKYLKEHKEELRAFYLTNKNVFAILTSLSENGILLNSYLEKARRLEELKVATVRFVEEIDDKYECGIYRDKNEKIINIRKYYTDGEITVLEENLEDEVFNYSEIPFSILNATFLLEASNNEQYYQHRSVYIKNFGFDGSKLPSEEELASYDIPRQLIKK